MNARELLFTFLFLGTLLPLFCQEASIPKQLVILRLFTGKSGLPSELLQDADAQIRKILIENGKYPVVGIEYRLGVDQVPVLLEKLKEWKTAPASFSDTVAIGDISISKPDFVSMAGAAMVIIPSIVEFKIDEEKKGTEIDRYKVAIKTAFDFIRLEGEPTRTTRFIETMGYDRERNRAIGDAVRTIAPLFRYELGLLQDLKVKTAILVFENGEAYIERGSKEGVLLGTEYSVRGGELQPTGQVVEREKALIIISEVTETVSLGTVIYADPDVGADDAVTEVNRFGIDISPYAYAFIPFSQQGIQGDVTSYAGLRVSLSKGVYTLRPVIAVELAAFPFTQYQTWFPVRALIGAELRVYFGRFELAALPMIGIEEWFAASSSEVSTFKGFGLRGTVQPSLLITRDIKVFLEGGYEYWFGGRQGFLAGGGVTIKL